MGKKKSRLNVNPSSPHSIREILRVGNRLQTPKLLTLSRFALFRGNLPKRGAKAVRGMTPHQNKTGIEIWSYDPKQAYL